MVLQLGLPGQGSLSFTHKHPGYESTQWILNRDLFSEEFSITGCFKDEYKCNFMWHEKINDSEVLVLVT